MEKVTENLPVEEWPTDPSDIEKYYEIPTIEIPQLLGLNIIDAEELAFSGYILPTIKLVDSEEAPGLVLTQSIESGEEMPEGTEVILEVSGKKFSGQAKENYIKYFSEDVYKLSWNEIINNL